MSDAMAAARNTMVRRAALAPLGAGHFFALIISQRVCAVQQVEEELKKDDRISRRSKINGTMGCIRMLTQTGGWSALLRGALPSAILTLTGMMAQSRIRTAAIDFFNAVEKSGGEHVAGSSRYIAIAAVTALLGWPLHAVVNVIQANYMTDIMTATRDEVSVSAQESQEKYSYRFKSIGDAWATAESTLGWHGILTNAWQVYVLNEVLLQAMVVLSATLVKASDAKHGASDVRHRVVYALLGLLLRLITYPLHTVELRMGMAPRKVVRGIQRGSRYSGFMDCLSQIRSKEGLGVLFNGFSFHVLISASIALIQCSVPYPPHPLGTLAVKKAAL